MFIVRTVYAALSAVPSSFPQIPLPSTYTRTWNAQIRPDFCARMEGCLRQAVQNY
jgi:hypothetical protein